MGDFFRETRIDSWIEAKRYFDAMLRENTDWVFRGHYKAEWRLQTSLERILSDRPIDLQVEEKIILEFRRRAHHYLSITEIPQSLLEWLALMQHHGSPTRLLDWTRSPYIAAFIAFEHTYKEEGDAAIWAIDSRWLADASIDRLERARREGLQIDSANLRSDASMRELMRSSVAVVLPMEPERMNERLTIQQGIFLFPTGARLSFESVLASYVDRQSHDHVRKIVIPKSQGLPSLIDLFRMNINAASLFPGIDGFARSLRTIPEITYATLGETEER